MKIAVLGATGPLGLQIVEQAVLGGHSVVALVRRPEALVDLQRKYNEPDAENQKLRVEKCNVFSCDSIAEHLDGCDALLSALGAKPTCCAEINLLTDSVPEMVEAMKKRGVDRLVLCTAAHTSRERDPEIGRVFFHLFVRGFIGRNMDDFWRAERFLQDKDECSDINFTVVKPTGLLNSPLKEDGEMVVTEGQAPRGNHTMRIPRANVAQFMLDCAEKGEWRRKLVAISF